MTKTTPEIDQLQADVDRIEEQLAAANQKLTSAKIAISGIAIGDTVTKNGEFYRVSGIDVSWSGKAWVKGRKRLKNGSWGNANHNLYGGWTKAESQP